jgi:hypothetical protein
VTAVAEERNVPDHSSIEKVSRPKEMEKAARFDFMEAARLRDEMFRLREI